jgi:hypothetical protein
MIARARLRPHHLVVDVTHTRYDHRARAIDIAQAGRAVLIAFGPPVRVRHQLRSIAAQLLSWYHTCARPPDCPPRPEP